MSGDVLVDLAELGSTDTTRRDQWGRYLVVPPGGEKAQGYTRATTVAKVLDDDGALAAWTATMAMTGAFLRRGLWAQWEVLIAEFDGNPWYSENPEGKARAKRLVRECAAVGGANDRAEAGTSMHTLTALHDVGRPPTHLSDESAADLAAYVDGLAAAGVSIVPGMIERTVVLDEYRVAGTFDRAALAHGFGDLPLIADLKTGTSLDYSMHSFAVQLAIYAHGDAIYEQGPAADGSQDRRVAMPEVNQEWGLILWLNLGTAKLELLLVDLVAGWEAFEHSMWTRDWRNLGVSVPFVPGAVPLSLRAPADGDLLPLLQASIDQIEQERRGPPGNFPSLAGLRGEAPTFSETRADADRRLSADTIASGEASSSPASPEATGSGAVPILTDTRAWLQGLMEQIGDDPDARHRLVQQWGTLHPSSAAVTNPKNGQMFGLRGSDAHELSDLDQIMGLVDDVMTHHGIEANEPKPVGATVLEMFPNSTLEPDTGGTTA